jgi:lipopolysaccharide/colanic/teichoic acid biosynthesis glycosyltransferase
VLEKPGTSRAQTNGPHLVDHPDRALSISRSRIADHSWSISAGKRLFDFVFSALVLAAFFLPMVLIGLCIRLTSRGPAIFRQQRVGQWGRMFTIYKFRSMELAGGQRGPGLTKLGDMRVTWIGRWLRKFKFDELPQFYNVLRGDMSVVGPRPKLPQYAERLTSSYRPGITGAASIAFRREEHILACVHADEVESIYHSCIKPMKANIDRVYMQTATFVTDLRLILATMTSRFAPPEIAELAAHEVLPAEEPVEVLELVHS